MSARGLSEDEETMLAELLAYMYNAIPWHKMHTSKNAHDIFNHRVRAAAKRSNLYEAISKLANYFGLQSLPTEAVQLVLALRSVESVVLDKLYREHAMWSMLGIIKAKELKACKSKGKNRPRLEVANEEG